MRPGSYDNIIKDNVVLGRLKFIVKGEETQVYRLAILDTMLNEGIKNSEAYQTFLALSTGLIPLKKGRGKSISKTEVEISKEERRVHKTYKCLVTKKPTSYEESDEADDDQEGIQVMTEEEQLVADTKKAIKASKKANRIQQQSIGSSEGDGITPEVPYEPKGSEIEWLLSDDEEKAEDDEEKIHNDDKDDDDDDKSINIEESGDERTKSNNDDQVMDDAEKNDAEKAKEEKDAAKEKKGKKQAMDEQEEDDQIRALVFVKHKEKSDLLRSTSSHSLSSNYGNQFLNISSDISLGGIIQEPVDTEINSMIDVPV
ncbi:hypothetical protein Tco_0145246 [Tanacetum coccineum]